MDDYEAIRQLTARYNFAFDNLDIEGWVNCFTEDAFFHRSNADRSYKGSDELTQLITEFSETFDDEWPSARRHQSQLVIGG